MLGLSAHILPVQTASAKQSIWHGQGLANFRKHVVALQRVSNKIPADPQEHSANLWISQTSTTEARNVLPFDVEQRIADDLAFIAAAEEGVKAISAVALEAHVSGHGLIVRLAANQVIPNTVPGAFGHIFELLSRCARNFSRNKCKDGLFDEIISLSQNRIHGRLQSALWNRPSHRRREPREPLHLKLREVCGRIAQMPSRNFHKSRALLQKLRELCDLFKQVDTCRKGSSEAMDQLKDVCRGCYEISTSDGEATLEETISAYGYSLEEVFHNKHIRQIYKIGRYWGLCIYMAEASRKYNEVFHSIDLMVTAPYEPIISPISYRGTSIDCHVHAEIQLLVFYDSTPNHWTLKPRIIGVSKAACFLCNAFIQEHSDFFVSKTHGKLYEQWNIPDLASFSEPQRLKYMRILRSIDKELLEAEVRERSHPRKRTDPLGSWLNLTTAFPLSPMASDAGTLDSAVSAPRIIAPASISKSQTSGTTLPQSQDQMAPQNLRATSPIAPFPTPRAPTPSSPPPAYTATVRDIETNQAPSPHGRGSLSHSSSSIASWEYPIQRTLRAATPFRKRNGKMILHFEIEGPAFGSVTIAAAGDSNSIIPVNVVAMKEGETLSFIRKNEDDCIVLDIQGSDGRETQVSLRWLWTKIGSDQD